jgi:uncharacterized protein
MSEVSKAIFSILALPGRAGVGLKPEHGSAILAGEASSSGIGFFEVHAENYVGAGGPPHALLSAIAACYPLSLHGVGLSIGSAGGLDKAHLARLKALVERYRPASFSEHLAWSSHGADAPGQEGAVFLNDLLPLPYTGETLARVCEHVDEVQTLLGCRMLLENPSTYVLFEQSTITEVEFLETISRRTGCGLLLDVNNVFVSATNHATSAKDYLEAFPLERVGEIHLAGHASMLDEAGATLLLDAHDRPVADAVWSLYAAVIARTGPLPTLIEWDNDVPPWPVLAAEARRADEVMATAARGSAASSRSGLAA